jgi:C-methyltransferase C-terminal domain/Putative zinc binding domain
MLGVTGDWANAGAARDMTAVCRACDSRDGQIVLDLGNQPAADHFPSQDDPGPDAVYPLQMWLCTSCGLAQLLADPVVPEEPLGAEPAALVEQAAHAVECVAEAGWLQRGLRLTEYGSPHGGSWASLVKARGLSIVDRTSHTEVVLDCFGLMHEANQGRALADRVALLEPRGVLLLQYHTLATIVRLSQWNSLRHGHYAYYSTTAIVEMLRRIGFIPRSAWQFDLYGGTVLLAATRTHSAGAEVDESVQSLLDDERRLRVRDPVRLQSLQWSAMQTAYVLREWLTEQQSAGVTVIGYGAASRAVALLYSAEVNSGSLCAVADASRAKQGRRMPGTDIPVISPREMVSARPDVVLLLLPDLLNEVRAKLPEIEALGGRWMDVEEFSAVQSEVSSLWASAKPRRAPSNPKER